MEEDDGGNGGIERRGYGAGPRHGGAPPRRPGRPCGKENKAIQQEYRGSVALLYEHHVSVHVREPCRSERRIVSPNAMMLSYERLLTGGYDNISGDTFLQG